MKETLQVIGYHVNHIEKGEIGDISKIREELQELEDAKSQGCLIMELVELSDLIGAVSLYLEKHHKGVSLQDLIKMSEITQRAFKAGTRK